MRTSEQVYQMVETINQIVSMLEKHEATTQADILQNLLADWIVGHVDKDGREDILKVHMQGVRIRIEQFEEDDAEVT
jgi:hypothetical protein